MYLNWFLLSLSKSSSIKFLYSSSTYNPPKSHDLK
nr:MAG TPA: hypothetical protein [Caudoviricetes sp.]DAS80209.1 MAG TPA: hypothetical protein [Caudoviricetes sp.]DAW44176.1 MAG TPA: hypothetical protein [Caudoviricetes sp.]DAX49760.1 MAG TPA: hypothetical protein [Caudoviricetes sp.]